MTKKSADINYISKDLFPKTYNRTMIDDDYIKQLEQENKQLKSQWCKLKEYLHNVDVVIDYSENYDGRFINYDELVNKMQELEGSDNYGSN